MLTSIFMLLKEGGDFMKASQVVKQALKWEGKSESNDSFIDIIDCYNTQKPLPRGYKVKTTDSWCATFISAIAVKLQCTDIIPTECSCQKMIEKFKAIRRWTENKNRVPNVGDIVFYDWKGDGWSDHVGIVINVKDNKITVLEGNYQNKVARRVIEVNSKYICGYGVPRYDKEDSESEVKYFKKYTGGSLSIVDALKSIGETSTFMYRCKIALANGMGSYKGNSAQNTKMLLLLKEGNLIKP